MNGIEKAIFRMLTISLMCLFILISSSLTCDAYAGRSTSKDGNLVVTYTVEEGYKITIRIDTKKKKGAYLRVTEGDVFAIKVDFVDVNGDRLEDVIIKYADESGYSPAVLINHDDLSFTDSLSEVKKANALYISAELEIKEGGRATRRGGYKVKNRDGNIELIFYDVFIGGKGYRYAAFRYDKPTKRHVLYQKGELFEEH